MPYLFPILEDLHRRTVPAIPAPRVEERNESIQGFSDRAREIVAYSFHTPTTRVKQTIDEIQWDEDRMGQGVLKTVWYQRYDIAEPARVTAPELMEPEIQRAMEENADPLTARITDDDIHEIHERVHGDELAQMLPEDPRSDSLGIHQQAHAAEMVAVSRAHPKLVRVPVEKYLYDNDVPWEDRAWEAELVSERVRDMLSRNWRNINETNLPPEHKQHEAEFNYEDMTAQTWRIHDRLNGKYIVIPENGRKDGVSLHKGDWPYGNIDIYIPVVFHPWSGDQLDGAPLVSLCLPILNELAEVDFHMTRHVQRHADYKALFPKGTLTDVDKSRLSDPEKAIVELSPQAILGMQESKPPPLPVGNLQHHKELMTKLRRLVGADVQDEGGEHAQRITATESGRRAESADARLDERQERMGAVLAQVARNFLSLYKKFATKDIMVRTVGPEGALYLQVDPSDIPEDLDLFIDLRGESEDAKSVAVQATKEFIDTAAALGYPLDVMKIVEYFGRRAGIQRPEQFRMDFQEQVGVPPVEPGMPNDNVAFGGGGGGAPGGGGQNANIPFPQQQTG